MAPSVTIVIPTYNRCDLLPSCIDSCLMQRDVPLELIVVDDGSTDATEAVLRAYGEQVCYHRTTSRRGPNSARNSGLACASGKYVKFLDHDDQLLPGTLRGEVDLADTTAADIVVSGWVHELAGPREAPVFTSIVDDVLAGKAVPTSAALYRRSSLVGRAWDETLSKLDDWDFFVGTALRCSRIETNAHPVYVWRQHPAQASRAASMAHNAREHHYILRKVEEELAHRSELTPHRRKRLAQYFYKELRTLALADPDLFRISLRHIYELDPAFVPREEERQRWMRVACRVLGVRRALLLHSSAKRALRRGRMGAWE